MAGLYRGYIGLRRDYVGLCWDHLGLCRDCTAQGVQDCGFCFGFRDLGIRALGFCGWLSASIMGSSASTTPPHTTPPRLPSNK